MRCGRRPSRAALYPDGFSLTEALIAAAMLTMVSACVGTWCLYFMLVLFGF